MNDTRGPFDVDMPKWITLGVSIAVAVLLVAAAHWVLRHKLAKVWNLADFIVSRTKVTAYTAGAVVGANLGLPSVQDVGWSTYQTIDHVMVILMIAALTAFGITNQYLINELPVLIFGTGRIGKQIASHIKAFGGTVYGVNTSGRAVPGFDAVYPISNYQAGLAKARVVVDGLPGTADTADFFDTRFFEQVNQLFLFINIGRGTTLDQDALLSAIDDSRVKFAALDVTTPEPLPKNHPLFERHQILLTQHTSWGEHVNAGRTGGLFRLFEQNLT